MISILFPFELKSKGRPRFNMRSGHAFTPSETRVFEKKMKLFAQSYANRHGVKMLVEPIAVTIEVFSFRPKKTKYDFPVTNTDADNQIKAALDALQGVLFENDRFVVDLSIKKRWTDKESHFYVHVDTLENVKFSSYLGE